MPHQVGMTLWKARAGIVLEWEWPCQKDQPWALDSMTSVALVAEFHHVRNQSVLRDEVVTMLYRTAGGFSGWSPSVHIVTHDIEGVMSMGHWRFRVWVLLDSAPCTSLGDVSLSLSLCSARMWLSPSCLSPPRE
jgi:hypothetical protein